MRVKASRKQSYRKPTDNQERDMDITEESAREQNQTTNAEVTGLGEEEGTLLLSNTQREREVLREEKWRKSEESRKVIMTSMDVVVLYPNLNIKRSAEECGKEIEESEVQYENVDYRWAGKFVASNMSQSDIDREKLTTIVPRRRNTFLV